MRWHLNRINDSIGIVKDGDRIINIHPLAIYFLLSESDMRRYGEAIKGLNRYMGFTRRIFRFHPISATDSTIFSKNLLEDFGTDISSYNMMVRLIDDGEGNYQYALSRVDFHQAPYSIDETILNFVEFVCQHDIENLRSGINRDMPSAHQDIRRKMIGTFSDAQHFSGGRRNAWGRLTGIDILIPPMPCACDRIQPTPPISNEPIYLESLELDNFQAAMMSEPKANRAIGRLQKAGFSERDARVAVRVLWEEMEAMFNAPDRKTSDEIARGIVDDKYGKALHRDFKQRNKPLQELIVYAEIKLVSSNKRKLKSGLEKKDWGVVFTINDVEFPIYFGKKIQKFIYIGILLRKKIGEHLYIHELQRNGKGRNARLTMENTKEWRKCMYDAFFKYADEDFASFTGKLIRNKDDEFGLDGQKLPKPTNLGAAKTQTNKLLEGKLADEALYYCAYNTYEDANGDSYYDVRIEPENITVPEEMTSLLTGFYTLTGIEPNDTQAIIE